MGTIRIEQYNSVGSAANRDAPVPDLHSVLATTVDATTSTSAETITLNPNTRVVSVYATEAHRVVCNSDTTGTVYAFVAAGERRDFGVQQGDALWYRADA
jgi:hypothetical protein